MRKALRDVGAALFGTTTNAFNPAARAGPSYPIDLEFSLRSTAPFPCRDERGVPLKRDGAGGVTYFPSQIACYALALFNRHVERRDAASRESFLRMAAWFMTAEDGLWRYDCDFAFADDILKGPWISAMAQGEGISVLVRAHRLTGDVRYLDRARRAVAPLLVPLAQGGLRSRIGGRWDFLEEYPLPRPRHTLNGFLFALIGLVDLATVLPEEADRVGLASLSASLKRNLAIWDLGYWSAYDAHRTAGGLPNPATVTYHRVHVAQLTWLAEQLGEPVLSACAARWFERQRRLRHRLRALRLKIAYRAAEPAGGMRLLPPGPPNPDTPGT